MSKKITKKETTIHANVEAERIVLGCCLYPDKDRAAKVYDDIIQIVNDNDFYDRSNQIFFTAIKELHNKGEDVNDISLYELLRKKDLVDVVGGMPAIFAISDLCTSTIQAKSAAKIVRERSNARKIVRSSRLAIEKIDSGADADEAKAYVEAEVAKIDGFHDDDVSLGNVGSEFINQIQSMRDGTYAPVRIPTGITSLDAKLPEGGIGKGEVMVISAPTSCGKSQLALNIALRLAIRDKKGVAMFSLEMPPEQVFKRMVQISSCCNIEQANMSPDKEAAFKPIVEATEKIEKSPIYIYNHIRNMSDLRAKCRNLKRKHDISMVVIDYLQLIPWDGKMQKHDGIAEVSHSIKQMAMELNVPVILLAQVNREGAKRGKLSIYDLKDSGDIENDADVILMMWPTCFDMAKSKKLDKTGKPYIDLSYSLVKNREGERDVVDKFIFDNSVGRIY
jgi:replicative DNA helicase